MSGLRVSRWLALGGLMLALGCRSAPKGPVITTPLFPDAIIARSTPTPGVSGSANSPLTIPLAVSTAAGPSLGLPPGAQPLNANALKLREGHADLANLPTVAPPAKDGQIEPPFVEVGSLEIKPLLVAPPPEAEGFAPAPNIPPPEVPRVIVQPLIVEMPPKPLPHKPSEQFGHASDYRWIVGVLDRHGKGGFWTLRYADIGSDDEWGGKVRLLEDTKLRELREGEFVYIEGELLAPRSAAGGKGKSLPPYRIISIRPAK
ncbi:MAG: hypothetical protein EXS09_15340 [Gemmataceae bacterium]|nr:hypothetical protein [Gemmataceae bacterium]